MRIINFIILITLVTLVIFAAINWHAIMAPVPLSLLFRDAEAPLGLILLSVTGLLTLLFLSFLVYMQSSTILLRKRLNRELAAQRELADKAEASRFTELRTFLEAELLRIKAQGTEIHEKVVAQLSATETVLKSTVEESATSLSAYIGELKDRLEQK